MEYKLFDDYITLQALLKETGIIQKQEQLNHFYEYPVLLTVSSENWGKTCVNDRISSPDK